MVVGGALIPGMEGSAGDSRLFLNFLGVGAPIQAVCVGGYLDSTAACLCSVVCEREQGFGAAESWFAPSQGILVSVPELGSD